MKSAFSSTDFADLAEACAALFGGNEQAEVNASSSSSGGGASEAASSAAGSERLPGQLPAEVAEILDELAYEVRHCCRLS